MSQQAEAGTSSGWLEHAAVSLLGQERQSRLLRRTRALRKDLGSREAAISTVSLWIQSSHAAWRTCFKAIVILSLSHLLVQTWFALPSLWGDGFLSATSWHTCRRLYLAQIGATSLAALISLHVQVRGLVGTEGIVPFPQHAADRIRRFPTTEQLLSWSRIRSEPVRWMARCMNVLEARWWAQDCHIDPQCPNNWWHKEDSGLTDAKLTKLCWIGEVASATLILSSLCEGLCGVGFLGFLADLILGALRLSSLFSATLAYRILRASTGVFTALQWDSLLIEANMLALPLTLPLLPGCFLPALMLPQQICAFKCMFGSGIVKRRSRCPRWAASTAMDLHYETQPLPHLASWYFHKLPHWWHAQECWIEFLIQLPFTFLQWGPWFCRLFGFLAYGSLMTAIASTGNYGFFNFQVLGLAISMLDDSLLPVALPPPCDPLPGWLAVLLLPLVVAFGLWVAAGSGLALLQLPRLSSVVCPAKDTLGEKALGVAQRAHEALASLGIGQSYGPFAGMTTFRWELIFELSADGEDWTQLEFPYKPGCINTRPRWMPLGHFARLDWRLWFVPLGMGRGRWDVPEWVEGFAAQLLQGSEPVARLTLQPEAITSKPPTFVRISVWDYHFSSCEPTVHCCPQVATTRQERDKAYHAGTWWQPPTPACKCSDNNVGENGNSNGASDLIADSIGAPWLGKEVQPSTEWGRWWYRRLVSRCGVYSLEQGQLHFLPEGGNKNQY